MSDDSKARLDAIMQGLSQTPQRFEYRTLLGILPDTMDEMEGMVKGLEEKMTELGQDGWEVANITWQVQVEDKTACIVIMKRGTWHSGHVVASTNITQEFVIHKLDQLALLSEETLGEIRDHVEAIRSKLYN